ncbi:MAG: hypothetical protein DRN30_04985 [Thermoplasmata archaeon]|nr:hypothetical protein [Euryarchaeota archaeon]RLF64828.1 MAG: hypothetical protein DRN30_04985 [Thermoplasmata archaeon]
MAKKEARCEACPNCGFIFDENFFPENITNTQVCPVCGSEEPRTTYWTGRLIIINSSKSEAWKILKDYRDIEEDIEGIFAVEME